MSNFKRMVEDQIQQVMHQPEPIVLTDDIKKQVLDKVNIMEPELSELGSYTPHTVIHLGEPPYPPDEDDYDEDEYYAAQIDKFIEDMKADGIIEMIDIPQEKWDDTSYLNRLQTEIEVWLSTIQPVGNWSTDEDLYKDR